VTRLILGTSSIAVTIPHLADRMRLALAPPSPSIIRAGDVRAGLLRIAERHMLCGR